MFETHSKTDPLTAPKIRLDLWIVTILVAVAFSTWVILVSLQRGVLALPPTYDDIEYFRDAAYRLHILKTSGVTGFIQYYFSNPPHSPLSTGIALIGFSIFGLEPWAAVSINAIFVALVIRLFLEITRPLPLFLSIAFVLSLLLHPYFYLLVLEFRPDPAAAILSAIGCAWIIFRPRDMRAPIIAGLFCGFALLAKPSVFFLTCLLFGVAFILSSLDAALSKDWQSVLGRLWRASATTIAIAGPHYVIAAHEIWGYVYQTIWGSTSAYWKTPMPVYQQILTYLIGKGGKFGMGWWVFIAPLLIFLYFQYSKLKSFGNAIRDPLVQLLAVAAVAWAFVSFAPIKTIFLGLPVSAFNLVIIGICAARLSILDRPLALRLVMVFFALGYVDYMQPWARRSEPEFTAEYARNKHLVLNELVETLNSRPDIKSSSVVIPITSFSINSGILDFSLAKRNTFIEFSGNSFSFDPVDYQSKKWNYLVEINGKKQNYDTAIPNYKIIDQIHNIIGQDTNIALIRSIPDPESGGFINVYQRK